MGAAFGDEDNPCAFHDSDTWLVVDAALAIVAGMATIVLVVLRHPFKIVGFGILLAVVGTILGWWAP